MGQAALLLATTVGILFVSATAFGVLMSRDVAMSRRQHGLFSMNLNASSTHGGRIDLAACAALMHPWREVTTTWGWGPLRCSCGLVRRPQSACG
jgi:hypothetical protein